MDALNEQTICIQCGSTITAVTEHHFGPMTFRHTHDKCEACERLDWFATAHCVLVRPYKPPRWRPSKKDGNDHG